MLVAIEDTRVLARVQIAADRRDDRLGDLVGARPDVLQVHGFPVVSGAERVGGEVDVEVSRERVRDHERW